MNAESLESSGSTRGPWGIWATAGLSLVTYVVFLAAGIGVLIAFAVSYIVDDPGMSANDFAELIVSDGTILYATVLASSPLGILTILLLARLRKGPTIREYICLYSTRLRNFIFWISLTVLFLAAADAVSWFLGNRFVPDLIVKQLQTASPVLLYFVAVILVAPIFEECLFRGFMFAGIKESRLGAPGAIVITALTWAAIHFQYDLYWIANIFLVGIVFGIARLKTNSLYLVIAMHATTNLMALLGASVGA